MMSDLTDAELAAQEGAFDDPAVDVPVLPDRALRMSAEEFLRYEGDFVPAGIHGSVYGRPAKSYRDDIAAWLDAHPHGTDSAHEFVRHLADLGPVDWITSAYSMSALDYRQAITTWLETHAGETSS